MIPDEIDNLIHRGRMAITASRELQVATAACEQRRKEEKAAHRRTQFEVSARDLLPESLHDSLMWTENDAEMYLQVRDFAPIVVALHEASTPEGPTYKVRTRPVAGEQATIFYVPTYEVDFLKDGDKFVRVRNLRSQSEVTDISVALALAEEQGQINRQLTKEVIEYNTKREQSRARYFQQSQAEPSLGDRIITLIQNVVESAVEERLSALERR